MRYGDVANVLTMVNTSAFLVAVIGHWYHVVDWFADGYLKDGETFIDSVVVEWKYCFCFVSFLVMEGCTKFLVLTHTP